MCQDSAAVVEIESLKTDVANKRESLGYGDIETTTVTDALRVAYVEVNDLAAALALMEEMHQGVVEALGEESFDAERAEMDIANILFRQGRFDEARPLHRKVAAAWVDKFGYGSEESLIALRNYELTLDRLNMHETMDALGQSIVDLCERHYGDDERTLRAMSHLAFLRASKKDFHGSREVHLAMEPLALRLKMGARYIIDLKRSLAEDAMGMGDWDQVFDLWQAIQLDAVAQLPPTDGLRMAIGRWPSKVPGTPEQWKRFRRSWKRLMGNRLGRRMAMRQMRRVAERSGLAISFDV
jgi:hypothetical protein